MRIYLMVALLVVGLSVVEKSAVADAIPSVVTIAAQRHFDEANANKISIKLTPIAGLYEAVVGAKLIYISADGKYLVKGDLHENDINLTEERRTELRISAINAIDEADMVVFAPKKGSWDTINVFTDVDCGYCVRVHKEIDQLNKAGIKVRYLAFPRAGVGSPTYNKMVSVWCADDRQKAMDDAKIKRQVQPATCNNPIYDEIHYRFQDVRK